MVLPNAYSFYTIIELKNPKLNYHKQGTNVCYCRRKAAIDNKPVGVALFQ